MSDHAIAALRKRRAEIVGQVHDAEKRVTNLRAALANLDAAIAILTPEHPDLDQRGINIRILIPSGYSG